MAAPSPPNDPATDPSVQDLIAARPWLRYHAMDGLLLDDVPLNGIADAVGTPTWVYSAATLRARYHALATAAQAADLDIAIHYAVKANDSRAVLALFNDLGAGADVVSGGELTKARRAGIPASRIVYSGVGKSAAELRLALDEDIGQINVESAEELAMLSAIAAATGRTARVALRVNPDVDAGTNDKIATGRATDKFGISYADAVALYAHAATLPTSGPSASPPISAARSCPSPPTATPSPVSPTSSSPCARPATRSKPSTAAAASASPTATNPPPRPPASPPP